MAVHLSQQVILRPRRVKLVGLLVLSLLFVAGGAWIIGSGDSSGWFCLIFFGLGAVVFAVMLLPGAAFLRLEPEGFTVCSMFRRNFTAWSSVERFGVTRIFMRSVVGINLTLGSGIAAGFGRLNASLVGFEGALPDTYGMSAAALAELMTDALTRARARTGKP